MFLFLGKRRRNIGLLLLHLLCLSTTTSTSSSSSSSSTRGETRRGRLTRPHVGQVGHHRHHLSLRGLQHGLAHYRLGSPCPGLFAGRPIGWRGGRDVQMMITGRWSFWCRGSCWCLPHSLETALGFGLVVLGTGRGYGRGVGTGGQVSSGGVLVDGVPTWTLRFRFGHGSWKSWKELFRILVLCVQGNNLCKEREEEGNDKGKERKERNVLFNNSLNTFYLWLYGIRHMVKDHSDRERGNLLPPLHGLLFLINNNCSFICTIPQTG